MPANRITSVPDPANNLRATQIPWSQDSHANLRLFVLLLHFNRAICLYMEGFDPSSFIIQHLNRDHLFARPVVRCVKFCSPVLSSVTTSP